MIAAAWGGQTIAAAPDATTTTNCKDAEHRAICPTANTAQAGVAVDDRDDALGSNRIIMAATDLGALHAEAPHHLPFFITAPGASDGLMVSTGLFLLAAVVGIGVFYFKLHALPEQMAHRGQKVQFELVAVLALLALFTHNHTFWVAGLLLALVPLPDFTTPLRTMASSLEKIANAQAAAPAPSPSTGAEPAEARSASIAQAGSHSGEPSGTSSGATATPGASGAADGDRHGS
jgi:hypothetical protein